MYFRSVLLHAVLNRRVTYASFACFATRCNMMRPHSIRSLGQKNELNKNKKKKTYNSLFIAICSIVFFFLYFSKFWLHWTKQPLFIFCICDYTVHLLFYYTATVISFLFQYSLFVVHCSIVSCFFAYFIYFFTYLLLMFMVLDVGFSMCF